MCLVVNHVILIWFNGIGHLNSQELICQQQSKIKKMSKSHIAQVGFLMPLISDLMGSGVNVERMLITPGLDRFK